MRHIFTGPVLLPLGGIAEVLVNLYSEHELPDDLVVEVATRDTPWATWGPPTDLDPQGVDR